MKPFRIAAVAALVLVAAAIAGVAQPHFASSADTSPAGAEITVTGTGSVSTVPDRASFGFTVETRAKTATEALARNNTQARAISAAVKAAGVSADDIQTSQISLSQQLSDKDQSVIGFIASDTITVTVKDLTRAGPVVDAAVGAGATGVSGPALDRSDQDALYRAALKAAVAQARTKAEAAAAAAGLQLGAVKQIVEGGGNAVPLPASSLSKDSGVSIDPGTQQIEATVSVTYRAS